MMYYILHHNDADGYLAAYNVYKYLTYHDICPTDIKFFECKYHSDFNFIKKIKENSIIYIVDFFDINLINKLKNKAKEIIVYDHHDSTIAKMKSINYPNVKIYCTNEPYVSACKFVYSELLDNIESFPNKDRLKYINNVISVWDTWDRDNSEISFFKEALPFKLIIESYDNPKDIYELMVTNDLDKIKQYAYKNYIKAIKRISKNFFICNLFINNKKYKVAIVNTTERSSLLYELAVENNWIQNRHPDIIMVFNYIKKNKIAVSMYSYNKSVDVSKIALKFGGGGHKGAAGFECNRIDFIDNKVIIIKE